MEGRIMILEELYNIILSRKKDLPDNSYVTSLFKSGDDRITQKVGEEAIEVVIASKNKSNERLVSETADLMFHTLVLLANRDINLTDVFDELERRKK
jgi:phosphoribosyl-AMP cyclohydrolase / phosphoribosyl-ATP pyrophosphohydrolase